MPNPNPPVPQNPEPRPSEQPLKPANPPAPTPPNPGQPPEPSAQELADQIAGAAVAAQAPKPAVAPAIEPPKQIEFTTATGQRFVGKDYEDIANQLKASVEAGSAEITRLRRTAQAAVGGQPEAGERPRFSNKRFFEMMVNEADEEAAANAIVYALAHKFGIPPNEVVPTILNTVEQGKNFQEARIINQFLANNPDYPASEEAYQAIWQKMKDMNAVFDPANLEVAHRACLQEKKYEPYVPEVVQGSQPLTTTTGAVPPLPLARSSAAASAPPPTDINRKAEEAMSPQQIKELVAELQSRGVVQ